MRIGIYSPGSISFSIKNYVDNIIQNLTGSDVEIKEFSGKHPRPDDVDLYWDPGATGGLAPDKILKDAAKPIVVTVHGAAPFTVDPGEYYVNVPMRILGSMQRRKRLVEWGYFRHRVSAVITVSKYAMSEIGSALGLNKELIYPIYHGVDHDVFRPSERDSDSKPYLLHISEYQPKKNLDRILRAFKVLSRSYDMDLLAVVPGYNKKERDPKIKIIREKVGHNDIVDLYRNATGFVFPSLHESFGMPIIEAMACGCPVVTSNTTACSEIAGQASLLIDPRSVDDISYAMRQLITNKRLWSELRDKGLKRAQEFSWGKSAEEHLNVFKGVLKDR
ncbi:MAG: glycosyltransferase family 4 protein [Nitrospirota bacterium]|nr:MAG: glycosyltransferase family 4 protein [Nitrospirota bacterium]